jgi:thiamine-phosphate pyrophosphorylase
MIIVISDTEIFANEASIVNLLFDEGLMMFHLRKYNNSKTEITDFLKLIKPEYRNRIALHQFHEMANEVGIDRLHFSEQDRSLKKESDLHELKQQGFILSTSIHNVNDYNSLSVYFDYAFMSPVFDSISKPNYKAQVFDLSSVNKKINTKLIALGGITAENCIQTFDMGFDGIALLGSIWKTENKVENFKNVSRRLTQIDSQSIADISLRNSAKNFAPSARN